ncbi:MAG TPA: hypothetical protein VKA48_11870 [Gammaproteobacteria bacterium]|nr:hypothetical protein [Gammaproteobacteria bacterium]
MSTESQQTPSSFTTLERVRSEGRLWADLCDQYGVENPDPPWRLSLEATCEALNAGTCALPTLERRSEEDELATTVYADLPFPERQVLALAHSMMERGLIDEEQLANRMNEVEKRLNSV